MVGEEIMRLNFENPKIFNFLVIIFICFTLVREVPGVNRILKNSENDLLSAVALENIYNFIKYQEWIAENKAVSTNNDFSPKL